MSDYTLVVPMNPGSLIATAKNLAPDTAEKGLYGEVEFVVKYQSHVNPELTDTVGRFCFSPFPGCCGILVSHYSMIYPKYRHTQFSQPFRDIKEAVARDLGYSVMLATNDLENIAGTGSMIKSGYKFAKTFLNRRTGHHIGIGVKDVKQT